MPEKRAARSSPSAAGVPASPRPADAGPRPAWTAFARKYRPRRFEDVVGQEAVGRTLRGALRAGAIPAAFLFAGPRGVGKTTMARLLARALNCVAGDGPTPDPCDACDVCREIGEGASLDVIEVDAASHNGVDDVRDIRERVAHVPARARYKVYILDEAHMFSTAAWNAFLKTLEEPPAHARFVFATTEAEKVPETIVSRCQRFDFRRIGTRDIVRTLAGIVERESAGRETPLRAPAPALEAIARYSRGGLRDAESLLEQALLAGDGEVREEDLAALLGTVPRERVRAALERAAAGDAAGALEAYAHVDAAGADAATFLGQALEMLREAMVLGIAGSSTGLVDLADGEREALAALGASLGRAGVLRAIQILAETIRLVRATDEERSLVEAALVRIAMAPAVRSPGEILDALAAMEARLAGAAAGAAEAPEPPPDPPAALPLGPGGAAPVVAPTSRPLFAGGTAAAPPADETEVLTLERVRAEWPRVLDEAKARARSLVAFLAPARPVVVADGAVTLAFPPGMAYHRGQCEEDGRRRVIAEALRAVFGVDLAPRFETGGGGAAAAGAGADDGPNGGGDAVAGDAAAESASGSAADAPSYDRPTREEVADLEESPLVKALSRHFRARMIHVQRREPSARDGEDRGTSEEAT